MSEPTVVYLVEGQTDLEPATYTKYWAHVRSTAWTYCGSAARSGCSTGWSITGDQKLLLRFSRAAESTWL